VPTCEDDPTQSGCDPSDPVPADPGFTG
jgi:hypothetical protein